MSDEPAKVDLASSDLAAEMRGAFEELFPGLLADGVLDASRLGEMLDIPVAEAPDTRERFGLMWAGKQEAVRSLLTPSCGALAPDPARSVHFDTACNVFIEGDNLEVLKLLQKAYNDQVKLIFIDPPYNTGNDFVYNDDFNDGLRNYLEYTGQVDDQGRMTSASSEVMGRRHSRWLSMIYPRLVLARNLLSQDGAIVVTIDDHEVHTLRMVMNEVFGEENFVAEIIWQHSLQPKGYTSTVSLHHNTLLCFRRSPEFTVSALDRTDEHNKNYSNPDNDPAGPWRSGDVRNALVRPNLRYDIPTPSGKTIPPPKNGWRWSRSTVEAKIATGEIVFSGDETRIIRKIYLSSLDGRAAESLWFGKEVGTTRDGTAELKEIFDGISPFDSPKPTALVRRAMKMCGVERDDIVLDFFAGSGSTAHAVALQNEEDGSRRRCISVNIPEPTPAESGADRLGFATVSAITEERIRRMMKSVNHAEDMGLRVYALSASAFGQAGDVTAAELFDLSEATLANQSPDMDAVAAEILLKEGVALDVRWERIDVSGAPIVIADRVAVVLSLDLNNEVVEGVLDLSHPVVVFLEDGFAGKDEVKTNAFTAARNAGITMKTV